MAVLYDEKEGDTVNLGKELDVVTAFNAFCVSTSNNSTTETDPCSNDEGDDIDTNSVYLNDMS